MGGGGEELRREGGLRRGGIESCDAVIAAVTSAPPSESAWTRPRTVLLLLALWLMATMGLRPLLLPDEGRYANVARDMLLSASSDGL